MATIYMYDILHLNRWFTIAIVVKVTRLRGLSQPSARVHRSSAPSTLTRLFLLRESVRFNVGLNDTQIGLTVDAVFFSSRQRGDGKRREEITNSGRDPTLSNIYGNPYPPPLRVLLEQLSGKQRVEERRGMSSYSNEPLTPAGL